jgi:hypothetical protein
MNKTVSAYYKALDAFYIDEPHKINKSDYAIYEKYKAKLDALEPYFNDYLYGYWFNFFRYKNPPLGHEKHVDKPRLAVFCKFKIIDTMYKDINTFKDFDTSHKELILHKNRELLESIIKEEDDGWNYNFDENGWYKGDKHLGTSYPSGKIQKDLTEKYYQLLMNEIDEI